ncbi:ATP binding protein [Apophysomyces ossiformis]|uniref:GPN-loop GTPase 3 n=1 Tax=Apophysomyces ossiformis TaxID=679940 RepID=A0A8H7BQA2_9FUNG|nr:ATP binding protein [Apophysomyces ossiformis]
MGPAGSGKSTYCATMMTHCQTTGRRVHLVNLDPAAENFEYEPTIDIRELITLEDVMEELDYGPNGGLIYCLEFLLNNVDWLEEEIGNYDDDYLIIDCPGQIELYTHFPIMRRICETLQRWNMTVCGVYCLESQFIEDKYKYFSGVLSAMSAMVNLEIPHVNVMTKMDLVQGDYGNKKEEENAGNEEEDETKKQRQRRRRRQWEKAMTERELERYLEPDPLLIAEEAGAVSEENRSSRSLKFNALNQAIVQLIDDYSMVSFIPLNITDEDSVEYVLSSVDHAMQYGEDLEPKSQDAWAPTPTDWHTYASVNPYYYPTYQQQCYNLQYMQQQQQQQQQNMYLQQSRRSSRSHTSANPGRSLGTSNSPGRKEARHKTRRETNDPARRARISNQRRMSGSPTPTPSETSVGRPPSLSSSCSAAPSTRRSSITSSVTSATSRTTISVQSDLDKPSLTKRLRKVFSMSHLRSGGDDGSDKQSIRSISTMASTKSSFSTRRRRSLSLGGLFHRKQMPANGCTLEKIEEKRQGLSVNTENTCVKKGILKNTRAYPDSPCSTEYSFPRPFPGDSLPSPSPSSSTASSTRPSKHSTRRKPYPENDNDDEEENHPLDGLLPLRGSPRLKPAMSSTSSVVSEQPQRSRRIQFCGTIQVHETLAASEYDRRCDPNATCQKLSPMLAMKIKQELNEYKLTDMEVHVDSRQFTHFFL